MSAEAITTLCERVEALEATVVELTEQNTRLADERERYHISIPTPLSSSIRQTLDIDPSVFFPRSSALRS